MNLKNIPENLHFLISFAEEWGIGDDGYRDEKIENSSIEQLTNLVKCFSSKVIDNLNSWLGNPKPAEPQTEEYYKFSSLFMAFEYGNALLIDRLQINKEILYKIKIFGQLHKCRTHIKNNSCIELINATSRVNIKIINTKEIQLDYNNFDEQKTILLDEFSIYDFLQNILNRENENEVEPKKGKIIDFTIYEEELKPKMIKIQDEKNYNHFLKQTKEETIRFEIEYFDGILVIKDKYGKLLSIVLELNKIKR